MSDEIEVIGSRDFKSLIDKPYKRWYQFGLRSPAVLWSRFRHKHYPILAVKRWTQRARRGWSDQDIWGFDYFLARTIRDAIRHWITWPPNGWPGNGMTYEQWLHFLAQIADGMDAYLQYTHPDLGDVEMSYEAIKAHNDEVQAAWDNGGKQKYERAMDLLKEYLPALWD